MNNSIKKILIWSLSSLLGLYLLAVTIALFLEDEVGRRLLIAANDRLEQPIRTSSFELSFLKHFPYATATLNDVTINDIKGKPLLKAKSVSLACGIWSVLAKDPTVDGLYINDATFNISIDPDGKANYEIWKKSKKSIKGNTVFHLSKATLNNTTIHFNNFASKLNTSIYFKESLIHGDFSEAITEIDLMYSGKINSIVSNKNVYLEEMPLNLDCTFQFNSISKTYNITNGFVDFNGNRINIDGKLTETKDGYQIKTKGKGEDLSLQTLIQLSGPDTRKQLENFSSTGKVTMNITIDGKLSKFENPSIKADFMLQDGSFEFQKNTPGMDHVSMRGSFSNGASRKLKTSKILIPEFKGSFDGIPFAASFTVSEMDDPLIDLKLNGKVPASRVIPLLKAQALQGASGNIVLQQIAIKGKASQWKNVTANSNITATGKISFENFSVNANGEDLKIPSGFLDLSRETLKLKNIHFTAIGTSAQMDGEIKGWFGNILDPNSRAEIKTKLTGGKLDLEKWIYIFSSPSKTKVTGNTKSTTPQVARNINGTINVELENIVYKAIKVENFAGSLNFAPSEMIVSGDAIAMGGTWNLEGQINYGSTNNLEAIVLSKKVDIQEFFRQCDNFGQETITSNHVRGKLITEMLLSAEWKQGQAFDMDKLHVYSAINIDNGQLVGLSILEQFSKYIKVKDLRNLQFKNLQMLFEIDKSNMYMPIVDIRSNALNLLVNGEHSFNNEIDYNLKLNAGDVLMNKLGIGSGSNVGNNKRRWLDMYWHLYGPMNGFAYKQDKSFVMKAFTSGEVRKHRILNALEAEFDDVIDPSDDYNDDVVEILGTDKDQIQSFQKESSSVKSSLTSTGFKSTWKEARETLKNPARPLPSTQKKFEDKEEEEEFLDFK